MINSYISIEGKITQEVADRKAADTGLKNDIDALSVRVDNLDGSSTGLTTKINQEILDRKSEDNILKELIDGERTEERVRTLSLRMQ